MHVRRCSSLARCVSVALDRSARWGLLGCCALLALASGCHGPSNHRDWSPNQAVLPTADFDGHLVHVHNVRNTEYRTAEDYTVQHYDKTYDLDELDSADFIMVPLPDVPGGAHTFLSFGFANQDHVAISIEIRRQKGEEFSALRSLAQPYEIMYVVGDERDLIRLRTIYWMEDVYIYRLRMPKSDTRALLVDMLKRANHLSKKPEYYNLANNNCTTNIARHINNVSPGRIPYSYQILFPAYSDRLAYDLNLIEHDGTFEQTRAQARVNEVAYIHRDSPNFSAQIRSHAPAALAERPGASTLRR